ncbi:hypothetical protein [Streptomyces paradoxus]|uniref:hypothetical protein n=1 Tax=Streptomyces paradoxus TaxID=66375 RepID=UPI0037D2DA13
MSGDWAVELHGISKRHGRGRTAVHALRGVDLTLRHGSYTAVMGLLKTSVLVRSSGGPTPVSAQGVTGSARDLAAVQDLAVERGRLPLKPGEIALRGETLER